MESAIPGQFLTFNTRLAASSFESQGSAFSPIRIENDFPYASVHETKLRHSQGICFYALVIGEGRDFGNETSHSCLHSQNIQLPGQDNLWRSHMYFEPLFPNE
jgi:hypothetical protein